LAAEQARLKAFDCKVKGSSYDYNKESTLLNQSTMASRFAIIKKFIVAHSLTDCTCQNLLLYSFDDTPWYKMINCCQRYPQACKPTDTDILSKMMTGITSELKGACKDPKVTYPQKTKPSFTTYRGSGYMPPGIAVGTVLKNNGFLSTSYNKDKAHEFAGTGYFLIFQMDSKVEGASLGECSVFQGANSEKEYLVNINQCFKITAITGSAPKSITVQHVSPCPSKTIPFI